MRADKCRRLQTGRSIEELNPKIMGTQGRGKHNEISGTEKDND